MKSEPLKDKKNLCNGSPEDCVDCSLKNKVRCEFKIKDTIIFFAPLIFFTIIAFYGMVISGYMLWIGIYLIFLALFYFIIENRILCSHCPYYAQEGKILKCHTHYGFYKAWRYRPGPMSHSEKILWLVGVFLSFLYPLIFLILGNQLILFLLSIAGIITWFPIIFIKSCNSCLNFSCPFNKVPEKVRKEYFIKNEIMRKGWKEE